MCHYNISPPILLQGDVLKHLYFLDHIPIDESELQQQQLKRAAHLSYSSGIYDKSALTSPLPVSGGIYGKKRAVAAAALPYSGGIYGKRSHIPYSGGIYGKRSQKLPFSGGIYGKRATTTTFSQPPQIRFDYEEQHEITQNPKYFNYFGDFL